jgi:hypothetical protein
VFGEAAVAAWTKASPMVVASVRAMRSLFILHLLVDVAEALTPEKMGGEQRPDH